MPGAIRHTQLYWTPTKAFEHGETTTYPRWFSRVQGSFVALLSCPAPGLPPFTFRSRHPAPFVKTIERLFAVIVA
jgi:hypothetical protein